MRTVQQMREESDGLQQVLVQVGAQIAANRAALAEESARLTNLGEETADPLTCLP